NDTGDGGPGRNSFINVETISGGAPVTPPPITGTPNPTPPPVTPGSGGSVSNNSNITLSKGILTITGDSKDSKITVGLDSGGLITAQVDSRPMRRFGKSLVDIVPINGRP